MLAEFTKRMEQEEPSNMVTYLLREAHAEKSETFATDRGLVIQFSIQ